MQTPVKLTVRSESQTWTHEIVALSMLEPSTQHVRFKTADGQVLEAHGCVLSYEGDINSLPSALDK